MAETFQLETMGIDAYADFTWGSTSYINMAVVSFALGYQLNGLPTAQIKPAIGQPMLNVLNRKVLGKTSTPPETGPIKIYIIIEAGGKKTTYLAFDGLISSISATQAMSGASSSAGLSINCVHKMSILATIPSAGRLIFNPSTSQTNIRNNEAKTYKKYVQTPNAASIDERFDFKINSNCMEGLKTLLKFFYLTENDDIDTNTSGAGSSKSDALKQAQAGAIELIDSIDAKGMEFAQNPVYNKTDWVIVKLNIWRQMADAWPGSSGWQVLLGFTDKMWGQIVATADTIKIIPNLACLKNASTKTIKATDIFGATRSRPLDPVTVKGIALMSMLTNVNDSTNTVGDQDTSYYVYPPNPVEKGMYMFAKPPPWLEFHKSRRQRSSSAGSSAANTRRQEVPGGSTSYNNTAQPEGATNTEVAIYTDIAKTMYGEYRWMRDSMTLEISMAKFLTLAPGQMVKVDAATTGTSGSLFAETYVGQIKSMDLVCYPGELHCNVNIGNLRSDSENTKYAMEKHPLYLSFDTKTIDDVQLFKKI
jgi:hypothetical protein